jgi:hypothetical protein
LARLSASETPVAAAAGQISSWWELWEQASPDAKNETCRLVFESVVLDFERRSVHVAPKPEFVSLFDARALYVAQGRPGRG